MERLKNTLARSKLIKNSYEQVRWRTSQIYRTVRSHDKMQEFSSLRADTTGNQKKPASEAGLFDKGYKLKPHPEASNPVLTKDDITDVLARFVADPFVVYEDGVYNMFFEIKCVGGDVFLGHAFSTDGVEYTYNKVIIEPEYAQHTYPNIFKRAENWYMVPSPGANVNGQFRVYKAVDFPTEWELIATPIPRRVRQDPTPVRNGDTWYVIYQDTQNWNTVLKYSDSLTGNDWKTHPESPLFENDADAIERCSIGGAEMVPSGRPIYNEDSIDIFYRSHVNREVYQYRITDLTRTSIKQHRYIDTPVFRDCGNEVWNRRFMHTVNPVYPWIPDDGIVAVDGLEKDRYRWSIGIYTIE